MSWDAHTEDLWHKDAVGIHLRQISSGSAKYLARVDLVMADEVPGKYREPAIEMSRDAARALYESLAMFFHGDALTVQQRETLDVERAWLGKFIEQATR